MINVDEKSTENIKIKKIIEKKSLKKKENSDIMMFDVVNVKNSNVKSFMKYYINDTMTISNSFTKFFFEFENFLKEKERDVNTREITEKKSLKKNENESFEKTKEKKQMNEFLFLFDVYINKFKRRALSIECDNFIIINTSCDAMKKVIIYIIRESNTTTM